VVVATREVAMTAEELFTLDEIAAKAKVGKPAVHKWIREKKLGYVVVGGERRITAAQWEQFIADSTREYHEKRPAPILVAA
jgi:excisionase family DNA binding protein